MRALTFCGNAPNRRPGVRVGHYCCKCTSVNTEACRSKHAHSLTQHSCLVLRETTHQFFQVLLLRLHVLALPLPFHLCLKKQPLDVSVLLYLLLQLTSLRHVLGMNRHRNHAQPLGDQQA